MSIRALVGGGVALLVGCSQPQAAARDAAADRAAVNAAMDAYATAIKTDSSVIPKFWVEDAVYIAPGSPTMRSRTALDSMHRAVVRPMKTMDPSVQVDETVVDQDYAFQTATYTYKLEPKAGAPAVVRGRLLFVWRRQPDGKWKIARGIATDAGT